MRTSGEYVPAGISILAVPVGTGIHQTPFRTYVPLSRSLQAAQRRPGGLGPRVVPDSQPAARTLSEWSRIEAVPVGTRTAVQLHDDEAPPDSRRVMGRFHSATADTLTPTLDDSSTRPMARDRPYHIVSLFIVRGHLEDRCGGSQGCFAVGCCCPGHSRRPGTLRKIHPVGIRSPLMSSISGRVESFFS